MHPEGSGWLREALRGSGVGKDFPFRDFPIDLWNKSVEVNMTGTFIITQQVAKQMLIQKSGNIINVASTYSLVSPNQNLYNFNEEDNQLFKPIDYVATKSMIPNFTRYLVAIKNSSGDTAWILVAAGNRGWGGIRTKSGLQPRTWKRLHAHVLGVSPHAMEGACNT